MLELVLASSVTMAGVVGQEPPVLEFGTDVRMFRLDVSVVDGRGRPIAGLANSDFEVFEDGEPVPVALFEAIEDGGTDVTPGESEMRSYYVLGYVPSRADDGRFREVKVKVGVRGATARTKGYLAGRPRPRP